MKKVLAITLCMIMVLTLFGCANETETTTTGATGEGSTTTAQDAEPAGDWILGASIYSAEDNFNTYIGKGITSAAEGVFKTNIEDAQGNQATQNNLVDTMLARGASVVALSLNDLAAATTILDKCTEAGDVPTIFFNNQVTDPNVIEKYDNFYQVTSTLEGGYGADIQGQMVVKYWNDNPEMDKNGDGILQVIVLLGALDHAASQPRFEEAMKVLDEKGIEYELLESESGEWDTTVAKEKTDAWISKHGNDIELIIAANDAMAIGALQSIQSAGFNEAGSTVGEDYICIIGIDALPEALEMIDEGLLIGSVLQDANAQGRTIVAVAENLVRERDVKTGIDFEYDEATKSFLVPYAEIWPGDTEFAKDTYR